MRLPLDPTTVYLAHFDETQTHQMPADSTGNCLPLAQPAGLGRPTSVDGIVSRARQWAATQGFQCTEAVADSTRITRDCTIEAVANLPWATTNGTYRLLTRGKSGSTAERELYGLQMVVTGAPGAPVVKLQMRWQDAAGVAATVPSVTFVPPTAPTPWLYLAATRRWLSTTSVEVAYYCNGVLLGTVTSSQGDIGNGSGGTMLVGCETGTPSGLPAGSLIDEVRVSSAVRSAEEIRWTQNYMFVFGAYGYELLKSLQPPGQARPQSPTSRFQQLFQVAGDALGVAWAKGAEMLDDFLPDRAWSFLDRWESVTRLAPTPGDSITTRRERVVGFLRRVQGFTRDQIVEAVVQLLDALTTDLQFLEASNIWLDEFPGVALDARWRNETGDGSIGVTGGHATLSCGAADVVPWTVALPKPVLARTTVPAELGVEVACKLTSLSLGENGAAVGIFLQNRVTGDVHMFGIKRSAGANKYWYATILAGVFAETFGPTIAAGTSYWLRYVDRSAVSLGTADVTYQVDGTTYDGPWTTLATMPAMNGERQWCGIFMSDTVNPVVTGSSVNVESFRLYAPNSRIVFNWYIYRDPALGGSPDLVGAQLVIDKMQPAHEDGTITTALACLYDDDNSGYDRTPLGA